MKVGIDFSRGEMEYKTGVEWYSWYVVKYLLDLGREHEIILYSRKGWLFRFGWTQIRLAWEMLIRPPDVLFVPSHILPPITPKRVVTMVHDIAFKRHPEWYSPRQVRVLELGIRRMIKKRAVVLVPTECVKQELLELYPETRNRGLYIIPHGVDHEIFHRHTPSPNTGEGWAEVVEDSREKVPSPSCTYFLFVGRLENKKNISRMIDAFVHVETGLRPVSVDRDSSRNDSQTRANGTSPKTDLILIGHPGHGYETFAHKLNHPNIHVLSSVSQQELVALYQNALALVFPTLYEGFGMPILEAMACGCPVITSKGGAHQEVAQNAAIFVNPEDVHDIARGMQMALDGDVRQRYIEKGLERVKKFSWNNTAQKVLDVLTKEI